MKYLKDKTFLQRVFMANSDGDIDALLSEYANTDTECKKLRKLVDTIPKMYKAHRAENIGRNVLAKRFNLDVNDVRSFLRIVYTPDFWDFLIGDVDFVTEVLFQGTKISEVAKSFDIDHESAARAASFLFRLKNGSEKVYDEVNPEWCDEAQDIISLLFDDDADDDENNFWDDDAEDENSLWGFDNCEDDMSFCCSEEESEEEAPEDTWTAGPGFINMYYKGKNYTASKGSAGFDQALKVLIEDNDISSAVELIAPVAIFERFVYGNIIIENGVFKYKDLVIDSGLTRTIIKHIQDGVKYEHLINFFENLIMNPRREAVYELYDFLSSGDIEITDDGHFLAYKKVQSNYMDIYSGKFNNSPGEEPEMLPSEVDDNRDHTCSRGLHVCSVGYLRHYGSSTNCRVVLCKVNPAHVVSCPRDYNFQKLRAWKYKVLKDVTEQLQGKY